MILDIHTHKSPPQPEAIVCAEAEGFSPAAQQWYSVGIHPWKASDADESAFQFLESAAALPCVKAMGEAGMDLSRDTPLFKQLIVMKRQVEISERLCKPLILHNVKAHDIIAGLRRDLKPRMPWIIHGFRGKAPTAQMLLKAGCLFSFGQYFNPDALRILPPEAIFAETDESPLPIAEIIRRLSECRGEDMTPVVAANACRILGTEPAQI